MRTVLVIAILLALSGCASTCDPQDVQCKQNAMSDAAEMGAGLGAAIDVISILGEPDTQTQTETRTCTTDFWGDQHCTVTVERH